MKKCLLIGFLQICSCFLLDAMANLEIVDSLDMKHISEFLLNRLTHEITVQLEPAEDIKSVLYSPNGLQMLARTDNNRVMIYDYQGNLITTIEPQLYRFEQIQSIIYSPDGLKILIETGDRLMIYDSQGNLITIISPQLHQSEQIQSALYSPDGSQILVGTKRRVMLYGLQGGDLLVTINPPLHQGELIQSVVYSSDGSQILIVTGQRMIFWFWLNFAHLNQSQKILLLKAYKVWSEGIPYMLNQDDIEIYNSLPEILKGRELFGFLAPEAA